MIGRADWADWERERGGLSFLDPAPGRPERYGWLEVTIWRPIPEWHALDYVLDL